MSPIKWGGGLGNYIVADTAHVLQVDLCVYIYVNILSVHNKYCVGCEVKLAYTKTHTLVCAYMYVYTQTNTKTCPGNTEAPVLYQH